MPPEVTKQRRRVEHFILATVCFRFHRGSILARGGMVISLVAFLACTLHMTAHAEERLVQIANKTKHCVLHIFAYGPDDKKKFSGTGFFVSKDGWLVSNHHILGKKAREENKIVRYEAVAWNGMRYKIGTVLAEHEDTDVALASVDLPAGATVPYLRFALERPRLGQHVVVIGNPVGLAWTVSTGIVAALRPNFVTRKKSQTTAKDKQQHHRKGNFLQISAPTTSGSSGSPVINMNSEVIGIHSFGRHNMDGALAQLHFASYAFNALLLRLPDGELLGNKLRKLYLAEAMADFEAAMNLAKTPRDQAKAYDKLAGQHFKQNKFQDASKWLKKAVECDPTYAMAQFHLGLAFQKLRDQASYEAQCKLLRTLDPKLAEKLEKKIPE